MEVKEVFEKSGIIPRPGQVEAAEALARVNGDALLVAPTGFGKTLTVLAAVKAKQMVPVLWLVRSLQVGRRVSGDAFRVNLKPFIAAGRGKTCNLKDPSEDVDEYCRLYRAVCPFFTELVREGVKGVAYSWEDIPSHVCRYYAQDAFILSSDVVVQNYRRRVTGSYSCVVVDEAHNLVKPQVWEVKIARLEEAVDELATLSPELFKNIRGAVGEREGILDVRLREIAEELLEIYREALARRRTTKLLTLAKLVKAAQRGAVVYKEENKLQVYFPPWRPIVEPRIYVSATIPEELEKLFNATVIKVPVHPRPAIVTEDLTSKYGEETIWGYYRLFSYLKKKYQRIIAFATDRIALKLIPVVEYFEEMPPPDWRGVAMFNIYGRFAEGIDLPAEAVVIVGAPFLPPEVTERIRKYYERLGLNPDAAQWVPMVTATLQAIGRATRNPEARPQIVLADYRFRRYSKFFMPYLEY